MKNFIKRQQIIQEIYFEDQKGAKDFVIQKIKEIL